MSDGRRDESGAGKTPFGVGHYSHWEVNKEGGGVETLRPGVVPPGPVSSPRPEYSPYVELRLQAHPEWLKAYDEILAIHARKVKDYGTRGDLLANLRAAEEFGLPAWMGVFLRMNDKMTRLKAYAQNGKLANEGVEDSLVDLANYGILALVLYREWEAKRGGSEKG